MDAKGCFRRVHLYRYSLDIDEIEYFRIVSSKEAVFVMILDEESKRFFA